MLEGSQNKLCVLRWWYFLYEYLDPEACNDKMDQLRLISRLGNCQTVTALECYQLVAELVFATLLLFFFTPLRLISFAPSLPLQLLLSCSKP
jgi:hypothetical protein